MHAVVQIATNVIDEGVRAARLAAEAGADGIDLNCGCPIYEATRRGLGAALLRKPAKLARLVSGGGAIHKGEWVGGAPGVRSGRTGPLHVLLLHGAHLQRTPACLPALAHPPSRPSLPASPLQVNGIAVQSPLPLTVKVRLGESASKINVEEVVGLLESAGAAAVTVHGRTMEQRYKKPADWGLVSWAAPARRACLAAAPARLPARHVPAAATQLILQTERLTAPHDRPLLPAGGQRGGGARRAAGGQRRRVDAV